VLALRIAFLSLLAVWLASGAVRMLRNGRGTLKGGVTITRRKNPAWFWASIVIQFLFVATGLVGVWLMIPKGR
jgi:hypothetical protein